MSPHMIPFRRTDMSSNTETVDENGIQNAVSVDHVPLATSPIKHKKVDQDNHNTETDYRLTHCERTYKRERISTEHIIRQAIPRFKV